MNLTKIAIDNNRVTIMVLLVIILLGLVGYQNLSRDSMPPYTVRVCTVVTRFPGASPERVEELITDKIEKVAQELPELKNVTSESRTGISIVSVTLQDDIDKESLQPVWDRLRRKIEEIQEDLPQGINGPNVNDDGLGVVFGIQLALEGDGIPFDELKEYADDIRDDLIKLSDASDITIQGVQEEQVYVEFDNARLARLGLSAGQLQNYLSVTNIVFPGGEVSLENERIVLEPTGNYETVDDLANTIINIGNQGQTVKLGEITTIKRGYKSPTNRIVRINGERALGISIALKEGANLIELGEQIDERVAGYNQELPVGLHLSRISSSDYFVDVKISDFVENVIQSVAIVLAVMLLFLGLRTGLVVASLIPCAMIMGLMLMDLVDVGLNQVSLAALIMALGMLVDNAIVVSESMMVKMEQGTPARKAALEAAQELFVPLLVSSLTTSAAFLAFFLADNTMGEIMGPLFVVITLVLLSSWILAMTIIPMFAISAIKVEKKDEEKKDIFDRLNVYYQDFLEWALRHAWITVAAIVVLFFVSMSLFGRLPFIFFPDSDRNLVTMNINLPLGTKIERTEDVIAEIDSFITHELKVEDESQAGVLNWASFISEGPESYDLGYQPGEANTGYSHVLVNTSNFEHNQYVIDKLDAFCFNAFPDAEVDVSPLAGGGGGGADVEVRIFGEDPLELFRMAESIKQEMNKLPTKNIKDDWGPKIKKFVINTDEDKANRAGLTNQDIATSLRTALSGFDAGDFRDGEDNIPIIMRSLGAQEIDARDLGSIPIFSQNTGANVPLAQIAEIETDWQYAKIKRRDLYRTMVISCDAMTGFTPTNITDDLTPWLENEASNWKRGYTYELGGESEQSAEAMGAVIAKLPLAGFIILLLLVSQFNSFRKTAMVLSTIPLGIIGVVFGLLLFNSYFGFMGFLGVISLAGIVINNAIVLIDRIQIEEEIPGNSRYKAIIDAAHARFRPILLTTFTTTLGMIPLYLGGGLMWEPMAVAIMAGLLFATVITLIFIPVMYKLLFRINVES
ncbi:MAG: efflux RND transporter permease subunit [Bacteroidota bacterium]